MRHAPPRILVLPALILLALASAGCGSDEPTYGDEMVDALRRGKVSGARGNMESISVAVTNYVTQTGNLPEAADIDELADKLEPKYLRVFPRKDPWGNPYAWSSDGNGWTLRCSGVNGVMGDDDDIEMSDGQVTKLPAGMQRFQK